MKLFSTIVGLLASSFAAAALAQDSSLLLNGPQPADPSSPQQQSSQPLSLQTGSFIFRDLPAGSRPRELQKHDIITIIVDYKTRMLSEGNSQARKTDTLNAVLTSWLRWDGKSIKNAPQTQGDPRIAGTYNSQYRTQSNVDTKDTLAVEIGAEIIDIRPNGNLYVEGNQTIRNNEECWKLSVSGEVRRESIMPDRTVSSKAMSHLEVFKEEQGQVRDGYARGWFNRWYDTYKPF
jgi:flagellar L-ring protein precursor FlgH